MKRIGVILFWTLCAVFAVPAILGVVLAATMLAVFIVLTIAMVLLSCALGAISCIPIIWLCGTWDGTAAQSLLRRIRAQSPVPVARQ